MQEWCLFILITHTRGFTTVNLLTPANEQTQGKSNLKIFKGQKPVPNSIFITRQVETLRKFFKGQKPILDSIFITKQVATYLHFSKD